MCQFHKPADEKRIVVVLPSEGYQDWLETPPEHSMVLMQPMPAEMLVAVAVPLATNGATASAPVCKYNGDRIELTHSVVCLGMSWSTLKGKM